MPFVSCTITNLRTGRVLASEGQIARDLSSRSKALLGRTGLKDSEALLITPCNSIHTFFMHFSIDVAFLDKNNRVVRIVKDIRPWRLESCHFIAKSTLEMSAGGIDKVDIKVGDLIKIQEKIK
jgi:uncharacterized protein